jgi:hypothetical protein
MKEYGIIKVKFGDDENESTMVQFGDGMTGIQSLLYDNGDVGVVMCRDGKHNEPFGFNEEKDTYASKEEKIFLTFDNERSIDVLIERLIEVRCFLK